MPIDLQPHLKGELVELRPLCEEDFDALFAVASDPLIWEQHPQHDRYKKEVFKVFFREAMDAGKSVGGRTSGGAFLVIDRKDDCVIGTTQYHGYDEEKSEIEIGWTFLARSHWGGVYNREMKHLLLLHIFKFVNSVIFLIGPDNIRSQRAIEKLGAIRDGTHLDSDGQEHFVYRIESSAFEGIETG